jgi:hypothetical protein
MVRNLVLLKEVGSLGKDPLLSEHVLNYTTTDKTKAVVWQFMKYMHFRKNFNRQRILY